MSRGVTETLPLLNLSENGPAKMTTATLTSAKTELRAPQVRLLLALDFPMNRADWAKSAKTDKAQCTEYVGSLNPEIREANDVKHFPCLISLKLIKVKFEDENGKTVAYFDRTAKGKKMAAKLS